MVTTELKDNVLNFIVENAPELFIGFSLHDVGEEYGVNYRIIDALLTEYENRGFISVSRTLGGGVQCNIKITAHDFIKMGGYKFEDALADIQLQKLTLEIESLQGSIPISKYNTLIAAVGAIATTLSLFKK